MHLGQKSFKVFRIFGNVIALSTILHLHIVIYIFILVYLLLLGNTVNNT